MQLRPAFPVDAVGGYCFITLRHEIPEGDMVIDLDRDLDALPAWGRLCVLPDAVRLMAELLGWKILDPSEDTPVKHLKAMVAQLTDENEALRKAMRDIMEVLVHAGAVEDLVSEL
jgi:hypothetical protein